MGGLSGVVGSPVLRVDVETLEGRISAHAGVVADLLTAAAGVLALLVVRRLSERQRPAGYEEST